MPGGNVNKHDLLGSVKSNEFTGLIQKSLECLGIRMGDFDSKKLTGTRADHSNDINPHMVAILGHPGFATLKVPSASGPWVPLKTGLVGKPDIYRFILKQVVELLAEYFALLLVLAVRPWLRVP